MGVFLLTLNLVVAVCLVRPCREAGLGLASTARAVFNVGLLMYALRRNLSRLGLSSLLQTIVTLLGGAVLAGGTAWWLSQIWEKQLGHTTLPLKLGAVFLPGAIAGLVYWLVAHWAK